MTERDQWMFIGFGLGGGLAFFLGVVAGASAESARMERRLVDQPEVIAAIRSRVLAERAEDRAIGGGQ